MARFQSDDESRDAGVILVFWVLCLSLLSALFVGVLALGNLLQSSDNAQNAADAAALAGEDYLAGIHTVGLMVENNIPIDWGDRCQVGGGNVAVQCTNYSWLYGYSIYEGNNWVPIDNRALSHKRTQLCRQRLDMRAPRDWTAPSSQWTSAIA